MNTKMKAGLFPLIILSLLVAGNTRAQTLINVDFGVGNKSAKTGFAASGQSTNDFWNLFRLYDPRYLPGTPLVFSGEMGGLRLADTSPTAVAISVTNAPGVWGNASGDPMFDSYIFAQNGSNIVIKISNLDSGRYNFYLYGHADPDASAEQNSVFRLRASGTNYGPLTAASAGWKATMPWEENHQFVVFRDVTVKGGTVTIEVAPGPNGVAVINGLQISSRGTSPPRVVENVAPSQVSGPTNLIVHRINYEGTVDDHEAKFTANLDVESFNTNEVSTVLFQGDVAVTPGNLPAGVRIARAGRDYRLFVAKQGANKLTLNIVAKIKRTEPWNEISFSGPAAAIASIRAQGSGGVEIQLLNGTAVESQKSKSHIDAYLNADRLVSLRWQSRGTEVTRKALINVTTTCKPIISATLARITTAFQYEMLQAPIARLRIAIPKDQSLTKLEGDQIRDWKIDNGTLAIEFIKPVEKSYALTLWTELPVNAAAELTSPQPLDVDRETGSISLFVDDAQVDVQSTSGLRQINAADNALAAYRFYARPWQVSIKIRAIEPVVKVTDHINAQLEETRLIASHSLNVSVEKAGIYSVMLNMPKNFTVSDVHGESIEEWKVTDGKLRISFASRVLGDRNLIVQLEQPLKVFPSSIAIEPLRITTATKESAQVAVSAQPGLRIKTAELIGLREIPMAQLRENVPQALDGLAFETEQADWKVTLNTERLPARITADVFDLFTIGDGIVGGSATIRYTLINQGVQEFRVTVPSHWRNIEFTGANIRGKEKQTSNNTNIDTWTISLQEKVWQGYTLVVTYDYQFDPKHATLAAAGLHVLNAEQENGSVAITTAANLKLEPKLTDTATTTNNIGALRTPLRQIDQSELAESDLALISRPVLLAYRYTGDDYHLQIDVTRHQEEQLLDAVADRTQITTVITEDGQMLTQASFMVKNNDRQFQKFQLPAGSEFWSCYVNGEASKAERDHDWLLVPLPRTANRNEAFAVDLVYAQKTDSLHAKLVPKSVEFLAPKTDVPNTYAEWEVYVPETRHISGFGGTMTVARGTIYGLREGWTRFIEFYQDVLHENGTMFAIFGAIVLAFVALIARARTRGATGLLEVLVVLVICAVMASMLLPALSRAKQKAQRIQAVNNLKQIGTAIRIYSNDNSNKLPKSYEEMWNELGQSEKVVIDPDSGERFTYVGAGKDADNPNTILAYSPVDRNGRAVLMGDGSVQQMSSEAFAAALENQSRTLSMAGTAGSHASSGALTVQSTPSAVPATSAPTSTGSDGIALSDGAHNFAWSPNSVNANPAPVAQQQAKPAEHAPKVAGIHSIRIDIPRKGQPFTFTKVLNISGDPLAVRMSVMNAGVFVVLRSLLQFVAFVAGLVIVWRSWRGVSAMTSAREAFWLAVGLALIITSVGQLAISTRTLHLLLIASAPVCVLIAFVWLTTKVWKRTAAPVAPPPLDAGPTVPPAVASIALFFLLGAMTVSAREAKPSDAQTPAATILTAAYSGNIGQQSAQFDGTLMLSSTGTNEIINLFGADVALQDFSVITGEAKLMQQTDGKPKVSVLLPKPGDVTIKIKLLTKLGGNVSKRELDFALPSALSSKLTANIDEPEADVEFPTAVSFTRATADQQTKVEAVIGSEDRVLMQWTPRVKRAAETAATVFVETRSIATVGNGALALRTELNYQIAQGELRQLRVELPAKHRLLKVEGEALRTWEIKSEKGADILLVDLLKGVSPTYRLIVESERLLDTLPTSIAIAVPHALDVKRENGLIGIRSTEELTLTIDHATNLQRVDNSEFSGEKDLFTAYRFIAPQFDFVVRAEPVQPRIDAVVHNETRIDTEKIHLSTRIDYAIKRAGVFELQLALPVGYRLESVSGGRISQWTTNNNVLTVSFKDRLIGPYPLMIELSKPNASSTKSTNLNVAGVLPISTAHAAFEKITGYVLVSGDVGIGLKATGFQGLTEVPASSVDGNGSRAGALAYKFLGAERRDESSPWSLNVGIEFLDPWIRAEIANIFTVTETHITGRAIVRYDIQNAPTKEFRLKIPTAFNNVDITGADIRRRDQNGDEWRIELQNKIHGTFTLSISWDQPRFSATNDIEIVGIDAVGVERETGTVTIKAKSPLQVQERSSGGELVKIDARELPDWSGVSASASGQSEAAVLVYRYLRPGYKLAINATRYDEAAVLQALIDQARLTTVVADDGQLMTELTFSVRNNGLQHLEIELPAGDKVWSAFVGGQPVRPAIRDGKLLLPLEDSITAADESVSIELTYVGREKFPSHSGQVDLISPKVDVPFKNARWDIFLPPDYAYANFIGTMNQQHDTAPTVRTYSLSEYRVQEAENKQARQAEAKSILSKGKSGGFFASRKISKYKAEDFEDKASRDEYNRLKEDARRAQTSNLLNNSQPADASRNGWGGGYQQNTDATVAQQQLTKLQAAQELGVTHVQPLRVNLPTRGVHFAFNQVLQTEVHKPMLIHFTAANLRTANWPTRILAVAGGFLALWLVAGLVLARRKNAD